MITKFKELADLLEQTQIGEKIIAKDLVSSPSALVDFKKRIGIKVALESSASFALVEDTSAACILNRVESSDVDSVEHLVLLWAQKVKVNDIRSITANWKNKEGFSVGINEAIPIGRFVSVKDSQIKYLYLVRYGEVLSSVIKWAAWFSTVGIVDPSNDVSSPLVQYGFKVADCLPQEPGKIVDNNFKRSASIVRAILDFSQTALDKFSTQTVQLRSSPEYEDTLRNMVLYGADVNWVEIHPLNEPDANPRIRLNGDVFSIYPIMQHFMPIHGKDEFYLARLVYDPIYLWVKKTIDSNKNWVVANIFPSESLNEANQRLTVQFDPDDLVIIPPFDPSEFPDVSQENKDAFQKIYDNAELITGINMRKIRYADIPGWFNIKFTAPSPSATAEDEEDGEEESNNDLLEENDDAEQAKNKFGRMIGKSGYSQEFKEAYEDWRALPVGLPYLEVLEEKKVLFQRMKDPNRYKDVFSTEKIEDQSLNLKGYAAKLTDPNEFPSVYLVQSEQGIPAFYKTKDNLEQLSPSSEPYSPFPNSDLKKTWDKMIQLSLNYNAMPSLITPQ